jgi:hypothetical protein
MSINLLLLFPNMFFGICLLTLLTIGNKIYIVMKTDVYDEC